MELLKFLRYQNVIAFACILFSLWTGRTSAIQLCHHGHETTHLSNLNMTSISISGSNGMCSCRIKLNNDARVTMFPDMTVPNCSTNVSLSDSSYEFECQNRMIKAPQYVSDKTAGDILWLFVKSTSVSQAITGRLQIKLEQTNLSFSLDCFEANQNSSSTTGIKSTQAMTTTSTTTKSTQVLMTSMTPVDNELSTMQPASETNSSGTKTSSEGHSSSSESAPASSSITYDKLNGINEMEFPVAAVAGGIAGGLLAILFVILAVICFRRRNQEPNLLRNRAQMSIDQGNDNRAYDLDVPTLGDIKPLDVQSPDNTEHVHVENDLYVSAGTDNQPHHPQVDLASSAPGQYASTDDLNIDKSEVESVEGSEVVITSSGDLYAVVDESKKHQDQLVTDPNPTASLADLYSVVDPTMKHQDEMLFDSNPTQDDEFAVVNKKQDPQDIDPASIVSPSGDVYAVVNKKQDPQDIDPASIVSPSGDVYSVVNKKQDPQDLDPTSIVSPSGDVYAVVNKKQDPQDIHPTSMVSPSGDVYAVVNKKQDPQDLDTTNNFSPSGDVYSVVDMKNDPQVIDPNHMTSPPGDVYAVVEKKPEVDQNDHMARTSTYDEEEEAIRRLVDINAERPSSDTLQSTSL